MNCKNASLIVNPRAGQNVAKLPDVLAVLSAAGWKTNVALKEYGGHSMELARQRNKGKTNLIVAYGGDGTLNQVVNAVVENEKQPAIVGVIPGGTANMWAGDIGVPVDPVKAALSLVSSEEHKVDVGCIQVESITTQDNQPIASSKKKAPKTKLSQRNKKARHHFLLMAGLGFDAAVMRNVSKPLKQRIGPLAVGLTAAKNLPEHHPFPVEIRRGREELLWKGEASQIIIGNTRRYAMVLETTPEAFVDDGVLDVCVITADDPLSTIQQVGSLLLKRKPDDPATEILRGSHLTITVPVTVPLQVDGSAVKLKDYLDRADYEALKQIEHPDQVMVTYRIDALPQALRVAVPCTYNEELFEHHREHPHKHEDVKDYDMAKVSDGSDEGTVRQSSQQVHTEHHVTQPEHQVRDDTDDVKEIYSELSSFVEGFLEYGRKITVVGKAPDISESKTYIIAGSTPKRTTGEVKPVAVVVDGQTANFSHQGDRCTIEAIQELHEGSVIVVEGKKSKRGVIHATRLVI